MSFTLLIVSHFGEANIKTLSMVLNRNFDSLRCAFGDHNSGNAVDIVL